MLQHIDHKTLYLKSTCGLGNRITSILFAIRLLELKRFDRLTIIWENMNCSQFQLTDLFEILSNKIEVIDPSDSPISYDNHMEYYPLKSLSSWRCMANNIYCGHPPMITKEDINQKPNEIELEVLKFYPSYIKIRNNLEDIASHFPVTKEFIGLHCRRTDVDLNYLRNIEKSNCEIILPKLARIRDKIFSRQLSKFLEPSDKIFVASDDQITKDYYKSQLPNVITRNTKLSKNMWDIHPNSEKYKNWGQVLRTKSEIIEAFIELLILSKCHLVITDYFSSYAQLAYYLKGTKVRCISPEIPIILRARNKIR